MLQSRQRLKRKKEKDTISKAKEYKLILYIQSL